MNLLSRWVWMKSVTGRRGNTAPQPDPGDMGTAFGLDASIEALPEAEPVKPAPPEGRWAERLEGRPRR